MPALDSLGASLGAPATVVLLLGCVVVATLAQTLTGFAFGLVFLSLAAALDLATVQDAANVATVLTLCNAFAYFRAHRQPLPWGLMKPALLGGCVGVGAGLALLHLLSTAATQALELLLGSAIVLCALLLLVRAGTRSETAPPRQFVFAGLLSGLMGGLFGTSGPPIVYHLYRQPLPAELVRRALLLMFAVNAVVRLGLNVPAGGFSLRALMLSALALPLVPLTTRLALRLQPHLPAPALRLGVALLLSGTGAALVLHALDRS
ncbi:hypothetical protein CLD22_18285 [Rubrivivax gelatinosus]|nr:hypothetical protein [Rubrivivax gelatinosus]